MNHNKLIQTINDNESVKKQLFLNYIMDYLKELLHDHQTITINENGIYFVNGKIFSIKDNVSIETLIDEFEGNMPLYKQYCDDINIILNNNMKLLQVKLNELANDIKHKYFYYKDIQFILIKNVYGSNMTKYNTIQILFDGKFCDSWNIKVEGLYTINSNDLEFRISEKLESLCKDRITGIMTEELTKLVSHTGHKVVLDNKLKSGITIVKERYNKNKIMVPYDIIINKQIYDEVLYELINFCDKLKFEKYLNEFRQKYSFTVKFNRDNPDYDLQKGFIKSTFDKEGFDNVKKLYEDVKYECDKYIKLNNTTYEKDMEDFEFMGVVKITKMLEKNIDGHRYVVYANKYKRRVNNLFFKDGIKVGRANFHKVSKLLGYNKKVTIDSEPSNNYWYKISKQPLTEEQIDIYSEHLIWHSISRYRPLSDRLLIKYVKKIDWKYVLENRRVSDKVLEVVAPIIGWDIISRYANRMSEQFINNHLQNFDMTQLMKNPAYKYLLDVAAALTK